MFLKVLLIILICLGCLLLVFLISIGVLSFVVFKKIFSRQDCKSLMDLDLKGTHYEKHLNELRRNISELLDREYKTIKINNDGLKLSARYYDENSKNTVIMCHGYGAQAFNNFHASSRSFFNHGYNVLMIDERSHNDSEGKYTTVGLKEQYDVLKWIKWVEENTNTTSICLYGVSMGATTLGYLSNKLDNTKVKAMIMDCGFTSFDDELFYKLKDNKLSFIIRFFIKCYAKMFLHINISNSTIDSLKDAKVPVYFIHGLDDEMVPFEHTIANFNATTSEKEVHYVKECGHTTGFLVDYDFLDKDVFMFLDKYM